MRSYHRYNTIRSSRDGSFPALLQEEGGFVEKPKKTSVHWLQRLKCGKPVADNWEHHMFDEESASIADDDRTFVVTDSEPPPIKRYYCSPVRRNYQYKREALDITDSTAETTTEDEDRTTGPVSVDDFIMLDDSSEYMSGSSSASSEGLPVSTSNADDEDEDEDQEKSSVRIGIKPFDIPSIPTSSDEAPNKFCESSFASDLSDDEDEDDIISENDDKSNSELYHYNFEMDVSAALSRIEEVSEYTRSSVSVDESHGGYSARALPLMKPDTEKHSFDDDDDKIIEEVIAAEEGPTTDDKQVDEEESSLAHDHAFEDRYLAPADDEQPMVLDAISSGENTVLTANGICRPRREDLSPISRPPAPSVMANNDSPRCPPDTSETAESASYLNSPGRLRMMALIHKFEQQSVAGTPPRNSSARLSSHGSVRFSDDDMSSKDESPPRRELQKSFFWRSYPEVSPTISKSSHQTKSNSSSSDEDVDLEDCRAIIHNIREHLIRRGSLKNMDEI